MPKKHVRKGAFWHVEKFKILLRELAANGALSIIDACRLSQAFTPSVLNPLDVRTDFNLINCP